MRFGRAGRLPGKLRGLSESHTPAAFLRTASAKDFSRATEKCALQKAAAVRPRRKRGWAFRCEQPLLFGFRCKRNALSIKKMREKVNLFSGIPEESADFLHITTNNRRKHPFFVAFVHQSTKTGAVRKSTAPEKFVYSPSDAVSSPVPGGPSSKSPSSPSWGSTPSCGSSAFAVPFTSFA